MRRYETVRFNWYRQCFIPCYVIPENCSKMFESSCLTAQDVNLQRRRFLAHQGKWRPKPLLILLPLKNEKNFLCSAGIYSLICLREEGTESLAGGGPIQLIPLLHLARADTKRWALVDRFNKRRSDSRFRCFFKPQ